MTNPTEETWVFLPEVGFGQVVTEDRSRPIANEVDQREDGYLIAAAPDLYRIVEKLGAHAQKGILRGVPYEDEPECLWCGILSKYGHEDGCALNAALKKAQGETELHPLIDVDTVDEGPIRTVSGKKARGET